MEANFEVAINDLSAIEQGLQSQLDAVGRAKSALLEVTGNGSAPTAPAASEGSRESGSGQGAKRGPGRPPGSTNRRGPGRKGNRAEQAVNLIERTPGITIPEIAKRMGIEPNYLYRVVPKLEKEGKVRKEGQGFVAVAA